MSGARRALSALALAAAFCAGGAARAETGEDAELTFCLDSEGHANDAVARDAVRACNAAGQRVDETADPELAAAIRIARAVALRRIGMLGASLDDLTKALSLTPEDASALRMRAWTFREMGATAMAERDLTRSLELEPFWQGYLSRCVVRLDDDRPAEALPDCREAHSRFPTEDSTYFSALALLATGQIEPAAEIVAEGIVDGAESERLYYLLARAYLELSQTEKYQSALRNGLERYPESTRLKKMLSQKQR